MPFGRQRLDGVVVGIAETTDVPAERLVEIAGTRPDSVPAELVELALWMAHEYCSTPARALGLVLPPRGRAKTQLWAERAGGGDGDLRLTERQRAVRARLPGPARGDLAVLRRLEAKGLVAIAPRDVRRAPRADALADTAVELTPEQ